MLIIILNCFCRYDVAHANPGGLVYDVAAARRHSLAANTEYMLAGEGDASSEDDALDPPRYFSFTMRIVIYIYIYTYIVWPMYFPCSVHSTKPLWTAIEDKCPCMHVTKHVQR